MSMNNKLLPDNTSKSLINLLQARLVDGLDLSGQAKQAHWTVKGPSFISLHELFDRVHSEAMTSVDMIAERIAALGGQAAGTARIVAQTSSLEEYPLDIVEQDAHVDALSSALLGFAQGVRKASVDASRIGDEATADLFVEILRGVEKTHWFVTAHNPAT